MVLMFLNKPSSFFLDQYIAKAFQAYISLAGWQFDRFLWQSFQSDQSAKNSRATFCIINQKGDFRSGAITKMFPCGVRYLILSLTISKIR